jgi:hypothetical protein
MNRKKLTKSQLEEKKSAQASATKGLKKLIKPGTTVYSVLRYRNRSRTGGVVAYLIIHKGRIINISANIADALGLQVG